MSQNNRDMLIGTGLLVVAVAICWFAAYKEINGLAIIAIFISMFAGMRYRSARETKNK